MKGIFRAFHGLTTFCTFTALLLLAPLPVQAEDYAYITNNGTITITGYTGPGGDITIPDTITGLPVTSIGGSSFRGCRTPTSVTIPNTVTNIGEEAFWDCESLTNVTVPNSVTSIGAQAFYSCIGLPSITIPNRVTSIGNGAFFNCRSLASIVIPNSLCSLPEQMFAFCISLTNVTIPNSVTSIPAGAFDNCSSLTTLTIPSSVTEIGMMAFTACYSLRGIYFFGNAPEVGNPWMLFHDDTNLVYYLPGTVGWSNSFTTRPTALWQLPQPVVLTVPPDFGLQADAFGFRISWATNASVTVEASDSPDCTPWLPLATNALVDGWTYFSDPDWTNYPARFYRVRSQ